MGAIAQGATGASSKIVGDNAVLAYHGPNNYVQIGANDPNASYIDLHSRQDGGGADYDARILATSGESGVNGRARIEMFANQYVFSGNLLNNKPTVAVSGAFVFPGGAAFVNTPTGQGRSSTLASITWTGQGGVDPNNPVNVIQLRDPDTNAPWYGTWKVYNNNLRGGGTTLANTSFQVVKGSPLAVASDREGGDLNSIYSTVTWNAAGYPQINIYNKSSQVGAYMVEGLYFPNNDGW
jgi:hypothetical protein